MTYWFYRSGVYTNPNCGDSNLGYHAVTIVGYGTLSSVDYWVNIYQLIHLIFLVMINAA
jgi:hypothetical protein